jgi:hypothetical protein
VSHLKERKEKICLNCNAEVMGKFCHICGQENIEPKESAWHLISHFFQDITHFDGKFFSTLGLLITRPGFLSAEYARGRRASYLNPIRMYIFTSAIFFLIFFSFFKVTGDNIIKTDPFKLNGKTLEEINKMDPVAFAAYTSNINEAKGKAMSREQFSKYYDSIATTAGINFTSTHYKSRAQYDSVLASGKKHHSWWQKKLIYKEIMLNKKFSNNPKEIISVAGEAFMHRLPQMLFVSLPLLALLLRLLYIRQKEFYYVSHGIFSIHLYIFLFIALLVSLSLGKANEVLHYGVLSFLRGLLFVAIFFYTYKAMRNFYQQRRAKTIIKFVLLNLLFLFIVAFLFLFFFFFSFFTI